MKRITFTIILTMIIAFTINAQVYFDTVSITTCEQYTWRGNTYTSSGIYFDTIELSTDDTTFNFTGTDQGFTVPSFVTTLHVELKGAGGGVGHDDYSHANGGSGAYVKGMVTVPYGSVVNVIVGEGGASGISDSNEVTYGGGTKGTYINNGHYGGAGGGRTAVQINGNDVASAGGGGGGGSSKDWSMKEGGAGGSGTGPNGGGTGGGYPYNEFAGDGAGGFSYVTDTLFNLATSTNGGANNGGDTLANADGGNGQALISWVNDSVYVLNLTIVESDVSVAQDGTKLTSNQGGVTYQWLDCDDNYSVISGETAQSFTATTNGNYAVELTNNGCVDTSECVSVTTAGINALGRNIEVSTYPNPTTGVVNIALSEKMSNVEINITDVHGQMLASQRFDGLSDTSIKMPKTSGIYFLTIKTEKGYRTIKLLRE